MFFAVAFYIVLADRLAGRGSDVEIASFSRAIIVRLRRYSPRHVSSCRSAQGAPRIQQLSPQNDAQRSLQAQALPLSIGLGATRWLLVEQRGSTIPMPVSRPVRSRRHRPWALTL